jgi:hypothetical protein
MFPVECSCTAVHDQAQHMTTAKHTTTLLTRVVIPEASYIKLDRNTHDRCAKLPVTHDDSCSSMIYDALCSFNSAIA